jgi:RimJ/RimL family protein N-acetyltransferase
MISDFDTPFNKYKKPYFIFSEIPSTEIIKFEKLTEENFQNLYLLFEGDTSPFVDERFKTYQGAEEYTKHLCKYGAILPKHGNQDWLYKWNDEYAGVLHLYDLSLEKFAQNDKRAWIGFATGEKFRNRRISYHVVNYFIEYIFDYYLMIDFVHSMTLKENKRATSFLNKCGFVADNDERLSKDHSFFIRERVWN